MRRYFASLVVACSVLVLGACGGGGGGGGIHTIEISPAFQSLAVGESTVLTARALDRHGRPIDGTVFAWTDGDLAKIVNDDGSVTVQAFAVGRQTIVATADGITGTAEVSIAAETDIRVSGHVIDGETEQGLGDALVVYGPPGGTEVGRVATRADGTFSFHVPPASRGPAAVFDIVVTRSGYAGTTLHGAVIVGPVTQLAPILLAPASTAAGGITGTVRNARTNDPVAGATLSITTGQVDDTVTGTPVATTTSGADGRYAFAKVPTGTYTLSASAPGFRNGFRTVITVPSGSEVTEDIIISPDTLDVRVVLTWGQTPEDLDLHATGPNADGSRFLVFGYEHGSATAPPYTSLDVDDKLSYGPETITVAQITPGTYRFAVHDFTNRLLGTSSALANSGAKVEVYTHTGVTRFYVPNAPGTVWNVFELTGDISNPTITPVSTMSYQSDATLIP